MVDASPSGSLSLDHFGRNLKRIRRHKELSRRSLAELSSIGERRIFDYEHGLRPSSLLVVEQLAAALEVSATELLAEAAAR